MLHGSVHKEKNSFSISGRGAKQVDENFQDLNFNTPRNSGRQAISPKFYPSLVMRSRNGAISSMNRRTQIILNAIQIDQEGSADVQPAPGKKKNMFLRRQIKDNNREERESF